MKKKTGKMPTALAKYWATHKRKRKANPINKRKLAALNAKTLRAVKKLTPFKRARLRTPRLSPLRKNPRAAYHLALKTPGGSRLYYAGGDKFSNVKKAASFASIDAVKIVARRLLLIYPSLRKYPVLAVPA